MNIYYLVSGAFVFFLIATFLFRLVWYSGYETAVSENDRSPQRQLIDWLNQNGVEYVTYNIEFQDGSLNVEAVEIRLQEPSFSYDYVFEFSQPYGQLVQHGFSDHLIT